MVFSSRYPHDLSTPGPSERVIESPNKAILNTPSSGLSVNTFFCIQYALFIISVTLIIVRLPS